MPQICKCQKWCDFKLFSSILLISLFFFCFLIFYLFLFFSGRKNVPPPSPSVFNSVSSSGCFPGELWAQLHMSVLCWKKISAFAPYDKGSRNPGSSPGSVRICGRIPLCPQRPPARSAFLFDRTFPSNKKEPSLSQRSFVPQEGQPFCLICLNDPGTVRTIVTAALSFLF